MALAHSPIRASTGPAHLPEAAAAVAAGCDNALSPAARQRQNLRRMPCATPGVGGASQCYGRRELLRSQDCKSQARATVEVKGYGQTIVSTRCRSWAASDVRGAGCCTAVRAAACGVERRTVQRIHVSHVLKAPDLDTAVIRAGEQRQRAIPKRQAVHRAPVPWEGLHVAPRPHVPHVHLLVGPSGCQQAPIMRDRRSQHCVRARTRRRQRPLPREGRA